MTDGTGTAPVSCPAAPRAAPPDPPGVRAAERLLADLRAEIGRADTKASVLIGALGVCAGVVLSRRWSTMPTGGAAELLVLVGAAAWVLALGFLLCATAPRYRASRWRTGRPLTYFLDIRLAAASGLLDEALRATDEALLTGLATALTDTSGIVVAKHRWIRAGLGCFALGVLVLGGGAVAGA